MQGYRKAGYVLGCVLLFVGFFLAFLPHAAHGRLGLEEDHIVHVISGMSFVIAGLVLLVWGSGARISLRSNGKKKFIR